MMESRKQREGISMKATNVQKESKNDPATSSKLGTWISVGVVAAVILVTYFIMFGLYMDRV